MIKRSGPAKSERKTVGDVLDEMYRDKARERLVWWAELLEIDKEQIRTLPFPSDSSNSVEGVDKAVKRKFANLIKQPKVMAKILGGKDE